mmetsp:Transcript_7974/g.28441  ORF Transcript_7974/g.28441 Transcript_7974/m.28441 type:complete len:227 (+) Transcript_7974:587-1267(+)
MDAVGCRAGCAARCTAGSPVGRATMRPAHSWTSSSSRCAHHRHLHVARHLTLLHEIRRPGRSARRVPSSHVLLCHVHQALLAHVGRRAAVCNLPAAVCGRVHGVATAGMLGHPRVHGEAVGSSVRRHRHHGVRHSCQRVCGRRGRVRCVCRRQAGALRRATRRARLDQRRTGGRQRIGAAHRRLLASTLRSLAWRWPHAELGGRRGAHHVASVGALAARRTAVVSR